MSSEVSVVRLQAENIDLKAALQKAEGRIEKLVQLATQAAVHDQTGFMDNSDADSDLIALIKKNIAKQQRSAPPRPTQAAAGASGGGADPAARVAALEAEVAKLMKQLEDSQRAARQLDLRCGEFERERDSLAEAVVDVKAAAAASAAAVARKLQQAESLLAANAASSEEKQMEMGMRIEELEEELKGAGAMNPTTQDAIDSEVARRVEEQVFSATIDFEEQLDKMKEENETLRTQVAEGRKAEAERDAAIEASKTAVSERSIALHVRDGAIEDAKKLRQEIQVLMKRIAELEAVVSASGNAATAASALGEADRREAQNALRQAIARAEAAETACNTAQELAKNADARVKKISASLQACEDENAESNLRIAALQQQIASLQRQSESSSAVLRAVEEAQQKEKDVTKKRHEAQMARLQAKFKDSNESTRAIFEKARAAYEKLIGRMRAATQPSDKEDLLCDLLFEYEHNLAKLQEEVASMRTVGDIRESDATVEMQRAVDEALSQIEILRMQIRELGRQPVC